MTPYDHYSEAKKLANLLERDGATTLSKDVLNAMEFGATGTEIFMRLRVAVKNSLSNAHIPDDSRRIAKTLLTHLERDLK